MALWAPPQPTLPPEVATDAYVVFYELVPRAGGIAPGPNGGPAAPQTSTGTSDDTGREKPAPDETVGPAWGRTPVDARRSSNHEPGPDAKSAAGGDRTPTEDAEDSDDVEMVDGTDSDDPMDSS